MTKSLLKKVSQGVSAMLLLWLWGLGSIMAQNYGIHQIPEHLKENAQAVIRHHYQELTIKDEKRASLYEEKVISIFSPSAAQKMAQLVVHYDPFDKISMIEGELLDAFGKRIRKLKDKDIQDLSATGSSFASDARVKVAKFHHNSLPYTVVFRYRKEIKGLFAFPAWMPQDDEYLSVQFSKLDVITSLELTVRHKALNLPKEPEILKEDKALRYRWEVQDLAAIEQEPYGPPWREYTPVVYLAPNQFEIEGYHGSARSWEEFGAFYYELNKDQHSLPPALQTKVQELIKGLQTDREKVEALYQYMQKNTRYVSIQLGLGGWQTYDPTYVFSNGYGDCKALSNYVQSMLAEVNIPAYPALVRAGDFASDILPDFSAAQFNHVILCVPNDGDTIWLECTVNHFPAGYLGQFTEDRYVLLATPNGGKLIRTPSSPPESNQQIRHATIELDQKGHAQVEVSVTATGYQQDLLAEMQSRLSEREQEKWLRNAIYAKSFELNHYEFEGSFPAHIPTYRYHYELIANNWANASGSRLFLAPNQLERYKNIPKKLSDRKQPVLTKYPYLDTDSIVYKLPEGFVIESMPEMPIQIESEFGTYTAEITFQPLKRTLIYYRKVYMQKTRRPAEAYEDFRNFMRDIVKADKVQIVLSGKS